MTTMQQEHEDEVNPRAENVMRLCSTALAMIGRGLPEDAFYDIARVKSLVKLIIAHESSIRSYEESSDLSFVKANMVEYEPIVDGGEVIHPEYLSATLDRFFKIESTDELEEFMSQLATPLSRSLDRQLVVWALEELLDGDIEGDWGFTVLERLVDLLEIDFTKFRQYFAEFVYPVILD